MEAVGKHDIHEYNPNRNLSHRSSSVSVSIAVSSNELNSGETSIQTSYTNKAELTPRVSRGSHHNNDGGKGWAQKKFLLLKHFLFRVLNPHDKIVEPLNQFVLISCVLAIFIDPLFFYLLSSKKDFKCIVINWRMAIILVVSRSITDLIYFMRMLIQFRLAFLSPESRVVGAGDWVTDPKKIALHYLSGFLFLDLFIVLPIPQIIVLFIVPNAILPGPNSAKFLVQSVILIQYAPRLYRFLPLLSGQSPSGFIFEKAWANFVINLLTFVLAGHVIGSCWYMLGLLRVNRCLQDACDNSTIADCKKFRDCGRGDNFKDFESDQRWNDWKQNINASGCFTGDGFDYGIYVKAVNLTTKDSVITRYVYSSFWGLQQISTLAGNQDPSYYVGETLFTMGIIGLGLLLFAVLIGNMQNFLQGLGRRRLEKSLRRRDVNQWMSHRRLPKEIRRKVRESERYDWEVTKGVNEEMLIENLPEDLQRDIRRHIFKFIKKARIFALLDEPVLDAICDRLRQKTYIKESTMLYLGGIVTNMIFIVRGKMESTGKDGNKVSLSEGDVCGEELIKWCLEHYSDNRGTRKQGNRLLSTQTVKCSENVEAFVLHAADLEDIITIFDGFSNNHRVQFAIRNKTPYWQGVAATTIQVAWRYKKKWLSLTKTSSGHTTRPSNGSKLLQL